MKPGNRVLDFGCGPGFFTREFAKRVGDTGMVLAVDMQEEMLRILQEKMRPEGLLPRIKTHRCDPDSLTLTPVYDGKIDVAFTIFVVHEVPDAAKLFREISTLLVPGGLLFISEPPIIVSGKEFRETLSLVQEAGLQTCREAVIFREPCSCAEERGVGTLLHFFCSLPCKNDPHSGVLLAKVIINGVNYVAKLTLV